MKASKNLAIIIAVVFFSVVVSLVVSRTVFGAYKKNLKYEVVEKISADFPQQDSDEYRANYAPIFNDQSLNPTQLIKIGETPGPKPNPF